MTHAVRGRPRAVVFDLDGTLVDTVADITRALNAALQHRGLESLPVAAVRLMIGKGPAVLVEKAVRYQLVEANPDLLAALTADFLRMHEQLGSRDSSLYAGAAECLAWLAQSGISVGVCSNKPHDFCVHLLSNLGVAGYCAAIRGSTAELPLKPDPALLLALVEAMGGELRHTLYVGDSDTDVQLARSAGVPVVLVNYGYSAIPADELGGDVVLGCLADLPTVWGETSVPMQRAGRPPR